MREVIIVIANLYMAGTFLMFLVLFVDWLFGIDKLTVVNDYISELEDDMFACFMFLLLCSWGSFLCYFAYGNEFVKALYLTFAFFAFIITFFVYGIGLIATLLISVRNFFLNRKKL